MFARRRLYLPNCYIKTVREGRDAQLARGVHDAGVAVVHLAPVIAAAAATVSGLHAARWVCGDDGSR